MIPDISLREVLESDLPIFFAQQLEPEAICMAAFPARDQTAFMAHWRKIMTDGTTILRTIVWHGNVAGNIVSWEDFGKWKVGYWFGKEYWGMGIASAALARFLGQVKIRPLFAHVAKRNAASIRVMQKCGFTVCGEDTFCGIDGEQGEEFIMTLQANETDQAG